MAAVALAILSTRILATDGVWTNKTSNSPWGTTSNWANGTVASGADATADFSTLDLNPAGRTVQLGANWTIGTLKFADIDPTTDFNWTVANGTGGPWALTLATTTATAPVVNVINQTATISAVLAGTQGFTKIGAGTLTLTGANTITGGISLAEGVLVFANNSLNSNLVTFTSAATLQWQNGNTQDYSANLKINDGVTATLNSGNASNIVTLATPFQLGPTANAAVTKTGAGTLILTAVNTYSGGTRVSNGRLILTSGDNRLLTTGAVILGQNANNGILQLGDTTFGASNQTVTSLTASSNAATNPTNAVVGGATVVSTLTVNNSAAVTYAGVLGGTGTNENNLALTKTGAGALTLNNAASTFTGGVNLNQGTLSFVDGALGTGAITFIGGSTLQWAAGNTRDVSGRIKVNDGVAAAFDTNGNNVTLATAFQTGALGTGALTKSGAGTLTLTAANTYTGATRLNNGRVVLAGGDGRLSSSTNLIFGNGANSGVLQLGDTNGPSNQTVSGIALAAGATGTGNAVVGGSASISTLTVNNSAAVTYAGVLGGTGTNENNLALTKTGAGTLTLGGNNSFVGDVSILAGTVAITNSNALGAGPKTVTVNGSLKLDGTAGGLSLGAGFGLVTSNDSSTAPAILNAAGDNVIAGPITLASGGGGGGQTRIQANGGSLTLNGTIAPAAGLPAAPTLILDGTATGTINGVLSQILNLTKEGTGTWSLNGANTYTGPTIISGGRLNLTTAQTGGGAVSLADGTALGVALVGAGQTLNTSALTLGSTTGTTLYINLGAFSNPANAVINAAAFTTAGTSTINISGTGLSVGEFDLITYAGSLGGAGFGGLTLGTLPARVTAHLVDAASKVRLNISAFDVPKWTGAADANWDINDGADPTTGLGTVNWKETNSGIATRYLQTGSTIDSVLFDDSATGSTTVNLTAALTPTTATVNNNTKTYTFTGSGKLSGATSLLKQGPGTLVIANTGGNDYTGTTTITAGTLQVGDGVTPSAGQLGSGNIVNNGSLVFFRPDDLTVANAISGTGGLVKRGTGVLTLSGNNASFDGGIEIAAGSLRVGSANALGSNVGTVTVQSGAALELTGQTITKTVQLNAGTLRSFSATTNSFNGSLSLNGGGTLDSLTGTSLAITTAITGTGGLLKSGPGTLILTGASTYAGGTTITEGVLQIGATGGAGTTGSLGTGDIALNPTSGTATLTILRGDNSLNIANSITSSGAGTNALIIGTNGASSPSGTVTLSGTNTFTGNVTISGGALRITNSAALGIGPKTVSIASNAGPSLQLDGTTGDLNLPANISFTASSDGTLINAASNAGAIINIAGNNTINGHIALTNGGGGNGRINVTAGSLTLNGGIDAAGSTGVRTLLLGGAGQGTANGVIADNGNVVSVTKDGAGTWNLTGANTFTGAVTVSAGTLRVNAIASNGTAQPLGTATGVVNIGTATTSGTLEYSGSANATLERGVTVAGVGGGFIRNTGGATLTLAGTLAKNGRVLTLADGAFNVTGAINGATAADLILDHATVTLNNTASAFAGGVQIIGGSTLRNGAADVLPNTASLTLGEATTNSGGTYDLNGFNEVIAGLNSAGTGAKFVTNTAASGLSFLAINGSGAFDGVIKDGPTALVALAKTGTGILNLAGANTYTGLTDVSGGTLLVSGSLNGTILNVHTGATLAGAGTITTNDQPVTIDDGAKLAPGNNGVGTLTFATGLEQLDLSGAFTDLASGALVFELATVAASDQIALSTGIVKIGSGLLAFGDFSFSALPGFGPGTYTLISSSNPILGDLDPANFAGTIGEYDAQLAFTNGGKDLALIVAVPEPGSGAALLGGLGVLLGLQRLRRSARRPSSKFVQVGV